MPRFYKDHARGYDLDRESPFFEKDGVRYLLGSEGSFLNACLICGEEAFRDRVTNESCGWGHGKTVPRTTENADQIDVAWLAHGEGRRLTTVEERKRRRLEDETKRPWNWVFGDKTEADFPLGYVKE